ncbi:MAG TPA: class I SAM-dependent methyltransferase [Solirubrobacteraceae bacterium]|nr:class I SAM-dependent methyltransferase [Solirubrobacteraceae bacterium]
MSSHLENESYDTKVSAELARYEAQEEVHDLPPIYHYWSERYCLPLLAEVGFAGLEDFFDEHVAEQCEIRAPERARLVSLGAGNGDTEIGILDRLRHRGIDNLELVLLELNPQMLARATADAERRGISDRVVSATVDLNDWRADADTDVYFANHSLHHVVALEDLFTEVKRSLTADGVFLVNDMIGRNGHVRWPEAGDLVRWIWSVAPERYRWNPFQASVDEVYPDHDCSTSGFEGIRAQDILPLLLDRFHPDVFITFLNVADPFIDRIYGPNFDVSNPDDLAFVDAVGRLDDAAIDLQLVTPTHLIASFRSRPTACRYPRRRSPQRTLRTPTDEPDGVQPGHDAGPLDAGEALGLREPEAAIAQLRREHDEAWGRYNHLRRRKAVRLALALAAARHWRPRGDGGRG